MSTTSRTNTTIYRSLCLCFALAIAVSLVQGCSSAQQNVIGSDLSGGQGSGNDNAVRCSTVSPPPDRRLAIDRSLKSIEEAPMVPRAAGSVTVRVFFHIIKNSAGEGSVSETAVKNQIKVLNDAFAGMAPGGAGAPTPFKFELAGVEEKTNDAWFEMAYQVQPTATEIDAKTTLNKGGMAALNIYTVRLPNRPFGWARFPWDPENVQGVVIGFRTLPGGTQLGFNEGDTATHEVGHWLGLFHTFENGCNAPGDHVEDTPPESGPTTMCPFPPNSCPGGGSDSINNFMNFTNDKCMFQFSAGQAQRMDVVHQEFRGDS